MNEELLITKECPNCNGQTHISFREDYSGMKVFCGWCKKEFIIFDNHSEELKELEVGKK